MKLLARKLRQNQTETEKRLWRHLRNRGLAGHTFRRQFPIGPYIADFVCLERRLVIEADGGQHMEQAAQDERRTEFIESKGFKVLRFWNNDVLQDIEVVLNVILSELTAPSSPALLPGGEGSKTELFSEEPDTG